MGWPLPPRPRARHPPLSPALGGPLGTSRSSHRDRRPPNRDPGCDPLPGLPLPFRDGLPAPPSVPRDRPGRPKPAKSSARGVRRPSWVSRVPAAHAFPKSPVHPEVPPPGTFRPQGLSPSRRFAPLRAVRACLIPLTPLGHPAFKAFPSRTGWPARHRPLPVLPLLPGLGPSASSTGLHPSESPFSRVGGLAPPAADALLAFHPLQGTPPADGHAFTSPPLTGFGHGPPTGDDHAPCPSGCRSAEAPPA